MLKMLARLAPALLLGALLAGHALAFPRQPAAPKPPVTPAAGAKSVTGPVKGAPNGNMFIIARKGGTVNVDAAGARVRDGSGKFTTVAGIKAGMMVTAKGTMNGDTLKASEVRIHARGGGKKPAPPKP